MSILDVLPHDISERLNDETALKGGAPRFEGAVLSFIGGGGKTTTIRNMAKALRDLGMKVVVTTTTKFYPFDDESFKDCAYEGQADFEAGSIAVLSNGINGEGKLVGISAEDVDRIAEVKGGFAVLVEADGSKGKSLKGHCSGEPVIPEASDHCFILMGLDAMGRAIDGESVHRPEIFAGIVKKDMGSLIDEDDYLSVLFGDGGYVSNIPKGVGYSVLLTKGGSVAPDVLDRLAARIRSRCDVFII
jgi:probable selenium-dependent hydroxylase accessory protein YqeC